MKMRSALSSTLLGGLLIVGCGTHSDSATASVQTDTTSVDYPDAPRDSAAARTGASPAQVSAAAATGPNDPPQDSAISSTGGADLPETNLYEIIVPQGTMVIRLYDETPAHRDNFKRLAADGVLDGTSFHRIISGFMIQGGDPNSKDDDPMNDGQGGPGYTLPAEFVPGLFHKRGAVAAARTGDQVNPERRSSGSQFYIVDGTPIDAQTLASIEDHIRQTIRDPEFNFSPEMRQAYLEDGGAPNLDMQYTVFAELVEGFDVLDRVAGVTTPGTLGERVHPALRDRPLEPVTMTVRPRAGQP